MTSKGLKALGPDAPPAASKRDSKRSRRLSGALLVGLCLMGAMAFSALGVWQLERRVWKLAMIETVNRRVKAAPVEAPGPAQWKELSAAGDAYRRVRVEGRYLGQASVRVQAVTDLGPGFWVLQGFCSDQGYVVLVNRGFIRGEDEGGGPKARASWPAPPAGRTVIYGLLRLSEPGGGFLRRNDPRAQRWYSRDVTAIAAALHLGPVAPYFIDADGAGEAPGGPVGGLTVIRFPNSHLVYAVTWFGLALMCLIGAGLVIRDWTLPLSSVASRDAA